MHRGEWQAPVWEWSVVHRAECLAAVSRAEHQRVQAEHLLHRRDRLM